MPKAISRRAALAAGAAIGVTVAGALPAWLALSDAPATIRAMIVRHLRGAAVADGTIDAFVADFLRSHGVRHSGVIIGNTCDALALNEVVEACAPNADYLRRLEQRVVDLFVRSTDLLAPDRGKGPIRYVAFWDPYSGACRNPLADFTPDA